jgi:ferredoxin
MVKVSVDYGTCSGCGTCEILCPSVFELRDDGKAWVLKTDVENNECNWEEIVNSCPTVSIIVEGLDI